MKKFFQGFFIAKKGVDTLALVKFLTATKEQLDKKETDTGCIYFVTDTNELYVDIPELGRISFSTPVDLDAVYSCTLERLLSDPTAIFQGATETADGAAGLVPVPKKIE